MESNNIENLNKKMNTRHILKNNDIRINELMNPNFENSREE